MKTYTVYTKPGPSRLSERAVFVKDGFDLFAFAFFGLWALYQRLWLTGVLLIMLSVVLVLLQEQGVIALSTAMACDIATRLMVGFLSPDLQAWRLQRKGYVLTDVVTGFNHVHAKQRFFDRYLEQNPLLKMGH
jgi:hypothetical protein